MTTQLTELFRTFAKARARQAPQLMLLVELVESAVAREFGLGEQDLAALRALTGAPDTNAAPRELLPDTDMDELIDLALLLQRIVELPPGERAEAMRDFDARSGAYDRRVASGEPVASRTKH